MEEKIESVKQLISPEIAANVTDDDCRRFILQKKGEVVGASEVILIN